MAALCCSFTITQRAQDPRSDADGRRRATRTNTACCSPFPSSVRTTLDGLVGVCGKRCSKRSLSRMKTTISRMRFGHPRRWRDWTRTCSKRLKKLAHEQQFEGGKHGWGSVRMACVDLEAHKLCVSRMGDSLKNIMKAVL
ncbi:MAG: hypothetical protein ACLR4Z_11990 [Butyricicoccaceae bacterium]